MDCHNLLNLAVHIMAEESYLDEKTQTCLWPRVKFSTGQNPLYNSPFADVCILYFQELMKDVPSLLVDTFCLLGT